MDQDETLYDFDRDLQGADAMLARGRQHPNDRETRRELKNTVGWLANVERSSSHELVPLGAEIAAHLCVGR